jgi:hypothetical protein
MQNMMLTTSSWKGGKTFKMIPTTADCPYVECIYDVGFKILAIVGKSSKETFHMVEKLDDNGDPMTKKTAAKGQDPFKRERRALETYQEYYIEEKEEIISFVKSFAENAGTFDFMKFIDMEVEPMQVPQGMQAV